MHPQPEPLRVSTYKQTRFDHTERTCDWHSIQYTLATLERGCTLDGSFISFPLYSIVTGFNFLIKFSQENVIVTWWIKNWSSIFNQPLSPGNWFIRTSLPTFQATLNGPGHPIIMQEVWALAVPSWRYSRIMASPRILCDAWSYIIKSWLMKIDCVDERFH